MVTYEAGPPPTLRWVSRSLATCQRARPRRPAWRLIRIVVPHVDHANVPRWAALVDHERRSGRNTAGGATGSGRPLRLLDDAAPHRPCGRDVPRRGRAARAATLTSRSGRK